jgi:hypothetical protein
MKSTEQIERSLRKLEVEPNEEKREQTRRDLLGAQARQRENKTPRWHRGSFRRAMMTVRTRKIAATVALALLLLAALGVGTGSVALSQTHHAVNATLAWLKSMIVGGGMETPPPLPPGVGQAGEQTGNPNLRLVTCAARFFRVPADQQRLWQSLKDQGIELVVVSTDPEVYYAALSRTQAETINGFLTLPCISAPRVTTSEGDTAALALTNAQPAGGLALGWLPTVSSDGKEIESTISFHDGHRGFELPNVSTESGGGVLLRVRGMFPP